MALINGKSGSINLKCVISPYIKARINWQEKYSVEDNYSIVYVTMDIDPNNAGYIGKWYPGGRYADQPGIIKVGGSQIATLSWATPATNVVNTTKPGVWHRVTNFDGTATAWASPPIYHNADGTATTTVETNNTGAYGESIGEMAAFAAASQSIVLTTIPRKSAITSAADITLGKPCNVRWTPFSGSFRYKLKFSIGSWQHLTDYITPNTTQAYTYIGYTVPLDAANQITGGASGTMTVTLYTYSGNAELGSDSDTCTATVPNNESTRPTISGLALSPTDTPLSGIYLQGRSKVQASFTAAGKYGAIVTAKKMTVEAKTYTAGEKSEYLVGSGNLTVTVTATDARGFTASKQTTIYVHPYSVPMVKVETCVRCDASGNPSDTGTKILIKASREYSKVSGGGIQHNFCTLRYRYAKQGEAMPAWTTLLSEGAAGDSEESVVGTINSSNVYIVQIGVVDTVGNTSEASYTILTEAVFIHERAGGNGIGFGMYCTGEKRFDCAWEANFYDGVKINGIALKDYILSVVNNG